MRKGIVLAGGLGTRFYPCSYGISKHFFPVYDKPMIYYPLSTLMLAGINDIAIISNLENVSLYKRLLGDGKAFGISLTYLIQKKPKGVPEALRISKKFLNNKPSVLILGDNIFYGSGFINILKEANRKIDTCSIFLYTVKDPSNFGIAELGIDNKVINMYEKPSNFVNNKAITGLYFFDSEAPNLSNKLEVSSRGELEIIELLNKYKKINKLYSFILSRGFIWFDAGTPNSLIDASNIIANIQNRQGNLVGSPEEVAYLNGWIDKNKLNENITKNINSVYGKYLSKLEI